jgi:hypothetical protein
MKKIIFAFVALFAFAIFVASCGSSRKVGCPNNQGIIH